MKSIFTLLILLTSLFSIASEGLKITVLDENNQPLTGVKLVAVDDQSSVYTDFDGVSILENLEDSKIYKVEIVGYESGFVKVSPNSDKEIEIVLRKK